MSLLAKMVRRRVGAVAALAALAALAAGGPGALPQAAGAPAGAESPSARGTSRSPLRTSITGLKAALAEAEGLRDKQKFAEAAAVYRRALESLAAEAGADSDAGSVAAVTLEAAAKIDDAALRVGRLDIGAREAMIALTFKPTKEAELPKGFPEPGPVGEIVVKQYPAYRAARTAMTDGQGSAFGVLFNHITRNKIEMTAPVEMTYDRPDGEAGGGGGAGGKPAALRPRAMAFLYGRPDLGEAGEGGKVEVVDVPAATAVSAGVRGAYTDDRLRKSAAKLEAWLKKNADRYEPAGPPRYLGYNSPFVPPWSQYGEVQIPVSEKAPAGEGPEPGSKAAE